MNVPRLQAGLLIYLPNVQMKKKTGPVEIFPPQTISTTVTSLTVPLTKSKILLSSIYVVRRRGLNIICALSTDT